MKRIRILTYWGVANYGAWTQAYALSKILHSIVDDDVDISHIAYLEKSHWDMYYLKDKRLENAFSYSWDIIPHTKRLDADELEETDADMLIIGSDAVWDFNKSYNEDYHLYGRNLRAKKMISYAASCNDLDVGYLHGKICAKDFERFDNISVRDEHTFNIVKTITEGEVIPKLVLDPALLWDFSKDPLIPETQYEDYILVYGLNWTEDFVQNAVNIAKQKNLLLVSVGYINKWCDVSLRLVELRVPEWIGMFSKASMVFTSTFHGLMLSLNYRKQVKFCCVDYVKQRSETLINALGIEHAIYNSDTDIIYEQVEGKLQEYRDSSIDFLKNCVRED